ncbi:hypothetical protein ACFY12_17445 [Streptomyces sp. NPDC001339]|uniref:hypothetical protein n=1 Tax=Streptomyces sp. NPDC001339 TaxID=3364563 RepID=UPI0036988181
MNSEMEWWANQRHLVEHSLARFEREQMSLKTLADDLMSFSQSFSDRGVEALGDLSADLQMSPTEWLEKFQSAAFGVEVIFSVAVDQNWDALPAEQVAALDDQLEALADLLSRLPA